MTFLLMSWLVIWKAKQFFIFVKLSQWQHLIVNQLDRHHSGKYLNISNNKIQKPLKPINSEFHCLVLYLEWYNIWHLSSDADNHICHAFPEFMVSLELKFFVIFKWSSQMQSMNMYEYFYNIWNGAILFGEY